MCWKTALLVRWARVTWSREVILWSLQTYGFAGFSTFPFCFNLLMCTVLVELFPLTWRVIPHLLGGRRTSILSFSSFLVSFQLSSRRKWTIALGMHYRCVGVKINASVILVMCGTGDEQIVYAIRDPLSRLLKMNWVVHAICAIGRQVSGGK